MHSGAIISPDGLYRYLLWRTWGPGRRIVCFIMLNPSTADANIDDPTIRRCISFAILWGFDGLAIGNLNAYRATKPVVLRTVADPVGPLNSFFVGMAVNSSELTVCAWGNHGALGGRDKAMIQRLRAFPLHALRVSKDGFPAHPLYIPADTKIIRFGS